MAKSLPGPARRWLLRAYRAAVFCGVVALVHLQHQRVQEERARIPVTLDDVRAVLPEARSTDGAIQTSPASDDVIGYAGPTNSLLVFGEDGRVAGFRVLSSEDTREHVNKVLGDRAFMATFDGLTRDEAAALRAFDGVSGATLTATAIVRGVQKRLGAEPPAGSALFPEPVTLADVQKLFPSAASFAEVGPGELSVVAAGGGRIGTAVRTSPEADRIIGYQGPTEALVGVGPDGRVAGFVVLASYDNDRYLRDIGWEKPYFETFNGMAAGELGGLDLAAAGVEGVSGATLTSYAIAEGIVARFAARPPGQGHGVLPDGPGRSSGWWEDVAPHEWGTLAVVVAGVVLAFGSLRGRPRVRTGFQLVVVGYLGLVAGNLVAQSLAVGWARSGAVPWLLAPGLAALAGAALVLPWSTGRNVYCQQLCPHGAAQQLVSRLSPFRHRAVPAAADRWLRRLPGATLTAVALLAVSAAPVNFAALEPFNAYVFRVAGWSTIALAVASLLAALFVRLPYCKYGCPTGALLEFVRSGGKADRFLRRDAAAGVLLLVAVGLVLVV